MGQVPKPNYLIIGGGKVATHFAHYFRLLGIAHIQWKRSQKAPRLAEKDLAKKIARSTNILFLICDDVIKEFVNKRSHLFLKPKVSNNSPRLIHFCGGLSVNGLSAAHPLMTFGPNLYTLKQYTKIPFILDEEDSMKFSDILPRLPNPHFRIKREQRKLYHALCVMGGNFPIIIWNQVYKELSNRIQLPPSILAPYLKRSLENFIQLKELSLTGPIARQDVKMIQSHLTALNHDRLLEPLKKIYEAFVQATR